MSEANLVPPSGSECPICKAVGGSEGCSYCCQDPEAWETAPCWCGEKTPHYADHTEGLDATCGGMGALHCHCGGDLCVCHNHGEVECDGCEDCEEADEDDDY